MKNTGNWKSAAEAVRNALRRRAPEILTGAGIAGMITTTVLAVRATPEAMRRMERKKKKDGLSRLTPKQSVQAAWKCDIPAGVTAGASIACLIGANTLQGRRRAALATAASLAETGLREYRSKVVETLGEKKESALLDAIDKDRLEQNPPPKAALEAPQTNGLTQPVLCYDAMFGRYFYSDIEALKRAANKLNWQMNNGCEPYISLNEFYMEIGLDTVDVGDDLGWRSDRGLIELRISSQLVQGRTPCLVMSHENPPEYGYNRM